MSNHNITLQQVILLGQHATASDNQAFRQQLGAYLKKNPNPKLSRYLDNMNLWHTEETADYFQESKFQAMEMLYELAELTPEQALAHTAKDMPDDMYANYVKELASRFVPKSVRHQAWAPAVCPTCTATLSTHLGDGYYNHPTFMEHCPNCKQALSWDEFNHIVIG